MPTSCIGKFLNRRSPELEIDISADIFACAFAKTALGTYLRNEADDTPENLRVGWEELEDIFGDRLVMRSNEETEYAMCAI